MSAETLRRTAPAKLNLCLHLGARRPDGYHDLASLVAFAELGDALAAAPASALSLTVDGPFAAAVPAGPDNLVLQAADALARAAAGAGRAVPGAHLALTKRLPVASGIGGGSSDAAAALHLLNALWGLRWPGPRLAAIGLPLGADVPVCLAAATQVMEGIGERLRPGPSLPAAALVLVNPGVPVPTAEVFRAVGERRGAVLPELPQGFAELPGLCAWLTATANDLEAPARRRAPEIAAVLAALRSRPECRFARMSGSGATCFALCDDDGAAAALAKAVARPGWWVAATRLRV